MGYTTDFSGVIKVTPPLNAEEIKYINKFADTRHMHRAQGEYYVDGEHGQDETGVFDANQPPPGVPGLWCHWVASDDGTEIAWDGGEKFYDSVDWMRYLIRHFVGDNPKAKNQLPFLQGHVLSGEILAQGEDMHDRWKLIVVDNVTGVIDLE